MKIKNVLLLTALVPAGLVGSSTPLVTPSSSPQSPGPSTSLLLDDVSSLFLKHLDEFCNSYIKSDKYNSEKVKKIFSDFILLEWQNAKILRRLRMMAIASNHLKEKLEKLAFKAGPQVEQAEHLKRYGGQVLVTYINPGTKKIDPITQEEFDDFSLYLFEKHILPMVTNKESHDKIIKTCDAVIQDLASNIKLDFGDIKKKIYLNHLIEPELEKLSRDLQSRNLSDAEQNRLLGLLKLDF